MSDLQESTDQHRARYIGALRDLAEFFETHPDLPTPATIPKALVYVGADDFPAAVKALGGHREKTSDDRWFNVTRQLGVAEIEVYTSRDEVCERVQVGTKPVEVSRDACPTCNGLVEQTPTGALTCREFGSEHFRAEPPAKTIDVVEEPVYEWKCSPVLDGQAVAS